MSNVVEFPKKIINYKSLNIAEKGLVALAINLWGGVPINDWTNPTTFIDYDKAVVFFALNKALDSRLFSENAKLAYKNIINKLT
jgi:hypothetical protein